MRMESGDGAGVHVKDAARNLSIKPFDTPLISSSEPRSSALAAEKNLNGGILIQLMETSSAAAECDSLPELISFDIGPIKNSFVSWGKIEGSIKKLVNHHFITSFTFTGGSDANETF